MKCKVDLINEIKSNKKLMNRSTEQKISHRKVIECFAKERIKLKKLRKLKCIINQIDMLI